MFRFVEAAGAAPWLPRRWPGRSPPRRRGGVGRTQIVLALVVVGRTDRRVRACLDGVREPGRKPFSLPHQRSETGFDNVSSAMALYVNSYRRTWQTALPPEPRGHRL